MGVWLEGDQEFKQPVRLLWLQNQWQENPPTYIQYKFWGFNFQFSAHYTNLM